MPRYLLKLDREHEAFVLFSTVVDGVVTRVMNRDEAFEALLKERGGPEEMIEAAVVRAELSGSSSHHGDYAWDDGPVMILDGGDKDIMVPRNELYDYVMKGEEREQQKG
jgi:hypothetical protein